MAEQTCPNCGKAYQIGDEVCRYCGLVFPFSTVVMPPGSVLQGRYEIRELIHTGGMGYIYLAKDKKLYDRDVIVKQVRESIKDEQHRKKLEEEASSMARLANPNIAMILDHFVEGGYYFLVVERIEGKTLGEVYKERGGQFSEREVLDWAVTICDVVAYLHSKNVIHRDISPDNIMLMENGTLKFIDFGTSHEFRYYGTEGTVGIGKYGYTPPEQWRGKPEQRSDIFAMGATIYYLLTGYLPLSQEYITGKSPQREDFNPEYPPIRMKNAEVSAGLEGVLQKALQLEIDKRYATAAELGKALKGLEKSKKKKPSPQVRSLAKVKPVWMWFSIAVIVFAIVGVTLKFTAFSGGTTITDGEEGLVVATTNTSENTPIEISDNNTGGDELLPGQIETTEPSLGPGEWEDIDFIYAFDKEEITTGETFSITISGNITCNCDIPYPVDSLCIIPRITARNPSAGEIQLIVSNNITADSIPIKQGDKTSFTQILFVRFPDDAETGDYNVYLNADEIKVNIGLWVEIAELFQLQEQFLGIVRYNGAETLQKSVEGYVRDIADNSPIVDAMICIWELIPLDDEHAYELIQATAYSNSNGYYKTDTFSGNGTYILQVSADGYITEWYNNAFDKEYATPLTFAPGETLNINILMLKISSPTMNASITGNVLDLATGLPVVDDSAGSIELSAGWHRLTYRHEETWGGQAARLAFKAPGDTDWRWFSTSELEIRTAPDHSAGEGMLLINRKNNWTEHPVNHEELVTCVETDSTEESGWYGTSIVSVINQGENIHGNDDYYTSFYEGYFYVDTAGTWHFSTDSDDASEVCIDDTVVAYWYNGHCPADRWENKYHIAIFSYNEDEFVASTGGNADGSYTISNLAPGSYRIDISASGYISQFYIVTISTGEIVTLNFNLEHQ